MLLPASIEAHSFGPKGLELPHAAFEALILESVDWILCKITKERFSKHKEYFVNLIYFSIKNKMKIKNLADSDYMYYSNRIKY